jgi:RecG-like helicase
MNNFEKLKQRRPELAKDLESMTKEELLNHYAAEVKEKEQLEEFKQTYDDYQTDLESIVNSAKRWLVKNKKTSHHLQITTKDMKLIYSNVEKNWI